MPILGMAVVMLAGCSEDTADSTATEASQSIIAYNADTQAETKTCIEATIGSNTSYVAVLWTPEDELGVFTDKEANVKYTKYDREKNEEVASFVPSETVSGTPQYVYFPYNEDAGTDVTALSGNVPAIQTMDTQKKTLPGDYKVGEYKGSTDKGVEFKFTHLFSPIRIVITGANTTVANDVLESVELTVTRGENSTPVYVCGDFTFNATKPEDYTLGTVKSNKITFDWSTETKLGTESYAYGTVLPQIKKDDKMHFVVRTSDHTATFTATAKVDFTANTLYTFPLTLSRFESSPEEYGYAVEERISPKITEFKFEVGKNSEKLLGNKLEWVSRKPTFNYDITEHSATPEGNEIKIMIPYLYDFKLVPTFTATAGCSVTVAGEAVNSGETEIDFTHPVVFTVSSGEESRDYTVRVTNTGLPVVVLKHSSTGSFNADYKDLGAQLSGKARNKFVDFMIRAKDTDWVEDDQITVYNADGTVNMTSTCGARLRGNTTQDYPKKPFAIKLTSKKSILEMPIHKRWVLLANWLDHSMIRNAVAFDIAHAIEAAWREHKTTVAATEYIGDGIPWNVHGQNVELVVFSKDGVGHHVGNYYLCEQIKIDGNRLDIKDPYDAKDNPAAFAGCGYLLEFDMKEDTDIKYTTSNGVCVKFKNVEPKSSDVYKAVSQKIQGIEDNLDNKEYAAAYEKLDINSMVDQFLIWELTMNREYGDPGSVYMFMDGNGKLSAGPVWDFDRGTFQNQEKAKSLGNTDSYRVKPDDAWMFNRSQESETYSYIWYRQLAEDTEFQNVVKTRWAVIYPSLKAVVNTIETYREPMRTSFEYDSAMWPTSKSDVQAYKSDFKDWSGDETTSDWDELVDNFKTVYEERLKGMNYLITNGIF